jgi:hypothetical protein
MDDDLIQLLIYAVIGIIGVIASAYKNRMKKQQAAARPRGPVIQPNIPGDTEKDFPPELGPLIELFDIPRPKAEPFEYETVESGPTVEEAGMKVDTEEASAELAGMTAETNEAVEKESPLDAPSLEEGQSDIQKMIAKYESIRKNLDQEGMQDDIASGEIISVEAEEKARKERLSEERFFNPRKAIIYSEILKRKEY